MLVAAPFRSSAGPIAFPGRPSLPRLLAALLAIVMLTAGFVHAEPADHAGPAMCVAAASDEGEACSPRKAGPSHDGCCALAGGCFWLLSSADPGAPWALEGERARALPAELRSGLGARQQFRPPKLLVS